jgi:4-hydroxy-3-polyprenylbenzoate decarboxylase
MKYSDLRDFIAKLKQSGDLVEIDVPVSPHLEMTELCDRTLRAGGPALLFNQPTGHTIPVLGNLFGTPKRVAMGMGAADVGELRRIGHLLARLKEPEPPKGFRDVLGLGSLVKSVWDMAPKEFEFGTVPRDCLGG